MPEGPFSSPRCVKASSGFGSSREGVVSREHEGSTGALRTELGNSGSP